MFKLYFERLMETVELLVRHPEYPNKGLVLVQCRHDVTELIRVGRITVAESELLYQVLDSYRQSTSDAQCGSWQSERGRVEHPARLERKACAGATSTR